MVKVSANDRDNDRQDNRKLAQDYKVSAKAAVIPFLDVGHEIDRFAIEISIPSIIVPKFNAGP